MTGESNLRIYPVLSRSKKAEDFCVGGYWVYGGNLTSTHRLLPFSSPVFLPKSSPDRYLSARVTNRFLLDAVFHPSTQNGLPWPKTGPACFTARQKCRTRDRDFSAVSPSTRPGREGVQGAPSPPGVMVDVAQGLHPARNYAPFPDWMSFVQCRCPGDRNVMLEPPR